MGNYSGKTIKVRMTITRKNLKQKLVELIDEADSDYMDISDEIVDALINKHKNIEDMVEDIMKMSNASDIDESLDEYDDMSCFMFNNSTYCSDVKYDITKIGEDKVKLFVEYSI